MNLIATLTAVTLILFSSFVRANEIQTRTERNVSAAVILSDSEVLTFGFQDFDPNIISPFQDDKFDSSEGSLRNRVAVTTMPYTFDLEGAQDGFSHQITVRASYLNLRNESEVEGRPELAKEQDEDEIYSGFVEYKLNIEFADEWTLKYGVGSHLMYYRNKHSYNSSYSQSFAPQLDGFAYNTSSWAYLVEPAMELQYKRERPWGYWKFMSDWHYFYGTTWGEANGGDAGNPEGWYYMNGIKFNYNLQNWDGFIPSAYTSFRRVDLGGNADKALGAENYYEWSFGVLLTQPYFRDYIDNVGIGFTINYGSALRGGSIVLFFNEI